MKKNELVFAATTFAILLVPAIYFLFTSVVFAEPSGTTPDYTITIGPNASVNLPYGVALRETGTPCSTNAQCASGYCCSSVCSASACPSAAEPSAATGTTIGGGGAATTITPTTPAPTAAATTPTPEAPAPAITPVPVTSVNIPVTETAQVQEVIQGLSPAALGIAEITPEKVEVRQTGVAETVITPAQIQSIVDAALTAATSPEAKQVLQEIKNEVSTGAATGITIYPKLEVFEVKSKETGQTTFVSKVTLEFKPDKDVKDVKIVETIPKSVASNIAQVVFSGIPPKVLQADPIVQWEFAEVKQGETKDLSYVVNKKLDKLETVTVAASQAVVVPAPKLVDMTAIYIIIGVGVVALAVWKFGFSKISKRHATKYQWRR